VSTRVVQADASWALAYVWVGQAVVEVYFLILARILGNNAGLLGWVEWSLKASRTACMRQTLGASLPLHQPISRMDGGKHIILVAIAPFLILFPARRLPLLPHIVQISLVSSSLEAWRNKYTRWAW
jgi:hypothetical protein